MIVSERAQAALEANHTAGRSCANMGGRCCAPASIIVTQQVWSRQINEGSARELTMTMCPQHATAIPVGYTGRNFIVTAQTAY